MLEWFNKEEFKLTGREEENENYHTYLCYKAWKNTILDKLQNDVLHSQEELAEDDDIFELGGRNIYANRNKDLKFEKIEMTLLSVENLPDGDVNNAMSEYNFIQTKGAKQVL